MINGILHVLFASLFLMHRVELKGFLAGAINMPLSEFLMHRVELKVINDCLNTIERASSLFLMHRVELKAINSFVILSTISVPNAPCGVESINKFR